ncbi:hypothetical protein VA7868_00536 [Vibrio aerogenes CECT 7868]|uniref:Type VI secretion system FHA domain-containing protein n=1 Tax=Vibrio aerogenes CECT 7868 TaxID=1216006 RepID=A0A1M5VXE6_9VIBR|nr:type VI secretion system-associated FHA domain protein TagH [Vibrio aerogenes]SHH79664.1 hypothetical protein VA7868_00536 [Vibrio aerogenes CECT 7868]
MTIEEQPLLNMVVVNVQLLESGLTPQSSWTPDGGRIGTSVDSFWRLTDKNGNIQPNHAQIEMIDGAFCLRDLCGETYVNGSLMPLGSGKLAKLENKDEVQIGPYKIRVYLGHNIKEDMASNHVLEQMFDNQDTLLADDNGEADLLHLSAKETGVVDPLLALEETMVKVEDDSNSLIEGVEEEPAADEIEEKRILSSEGYESQSKTLQETQQEDGEYDMTSSISLKKIFSFAGFNKTGRKSKQQSLRHQTSASEKTGEPVNHNLNTTDSNQSEGYGMDENVLDLLEEEVAKSMVSKPTQSDAENRYGQHLLTGPMLDGLGVNFLNDQDMEKMHFLSEEIGQSLQSCIKGLLELHRQVDHGRFEMLNRNLQPIEDNPLRLGLSYEETLKTLYDSDKSLVHLSAPAAIAESLKNIQDHNDAVLHATTEALQQILAAFSPQVLLRRFNNYKRLHEVHHESEEAWAWNMYSNYYQELTSNRQKGFEKLFWEIFEQAYDKKIREKQLEF